MLASIALLLTFSSARPHPHLYIPPKEVVITSQPPSELHLKMGQTVVFSLAGNASTGATWSVKDSGKPGLKYLGMSQLPQPNTNPPRVGQGSTYLIKFKVVRKGTYRLKLLYGRSWEIAKGKKPWSKITAMVVIK